VKEVLYYKKMMAAISDTTIYVGHWSKLPSWGITKLDDSSLVITTFGHTVSHKRIMN